MLEDGAERRSDCWLRVMASFHSVSQCILALLCNTVCVCVLTFGLETGVCIIVRLGLCFADFEFGFLSSRVSIRWLLCHRIRRT